MNNVVTVGAMLRRARLGAGISLTEASQSLRIHTKFLKALESGDYPLFSSPVHLKGFLKNYAAYLGLNVPEILAFFRREYPEEEMAMSGGSVKSLRPSVFTITPEKVVTGVVVILILSFLGYLFFQYRTFSGAPTLTISTPAFDLKTTEPTLSAFGRVDKDATFMINGQEISLSEEGEFRAQISLLDGVNILNFTAKNKLGKERKVSRTVILARETGMPGLASGRESSPSALPVPKALNLELVVGPNAAWLAVYADGSEGSLFEGLILSGGRKFFTANSKLKIRTGNAGSTQVIFNGQDQGRLGQEGDVVERELRRL